MRLIDADAEIKKIEAEIEKYEAEYQKWKENKNDRDLYDVDKKLREIKQNITDSKIEIRILKSYPTAYDVDKVVEQINNRIGILDNKNKICMDVGEFRASDRISDQMCEAIRIRKIVEKGGGE